jgi:hypothetical protein
MNDFGQSRETTVGGCVMSVRAVIAHDFLLRLPSITATIRARDRDVKRAISLGQIVPNSVIITFVIF